MPKQTTKKFTGTRQLPYVEEHTAQAFYREPIVLDLLEHFGQQPPFLTQDMSWSCTALACIGQIPVIAQASKKFARCFQSKAANLDPNAQSSNLPEPQHLQTLEDVQRQHDQQLILAPQVGQVVAIKSISGLLLPLSECINTTTTYLVYSLKNGLSSEIGDQDILEFLVTRLPQRRSVLENPDLFCHCFLILLLCIDKTQVSKKQLKSLPINPIVAEEHRNLYLHRLAHEICSEVISEAKLAISQASQQLTNIAGMTNNLVIGQLTRKVAGINLPTPPISLKQNSFSLQRRALSVNSMKQWERCLKNWNNAAHKLHSVGPHHVGSIRNPHYPFSALAIELKGSTLNRLKSLTEHSEVLLPQQIVQSCFSAPSYLENVNQEVSLQPRELRANNFLISHQAQLEVSNTLYKDYSFTHKPVSWILQKILFEYSHMSPPILEVNPRCSVSTGLVTRWMTAQFKLEKALPEDLRAKLHQCAQLLLIQRTFDLICTDGLFSSCNDQDFQLLKDDCQTVIQNQEVMFHEAWYVINTTPYFRHVFDQVIAQPNLRDSAALTAAFIHLLVRLSNSKQGAKFYTTALDHQKRIIPAEFSKCQHPQAASLVTGNTGIKQLLAVAKQIFRQKMSPPDQLELDQFAIRLNKLVLNKSLETGDDPKFLLYITSLPFTQNGLHYNAPQSSKVVASASVGSTKLISTLFSMTIKENTADAIVILKVIAQCTLAFLICVEHGDTADQLKQVRLIQSKFQHNSILWQVLQLLLKHAALQQLSETKVNLQDQSPLSEDLVKFLKPIKDADSLYKCNKFNNFKCTASRHAYSAAIRAARIAHQDGAQRPNLNLQSFDMPLHCWGLPMTTEMATQFDQLIQQDEIHSSCVTDQLTQINQFYWFFELRLHEPTQDSLPWNTYQRFPTTGQPGSLSVDRNQDRKIQYGYKPTDDQLRHQQFLKRKKARQQKARQQQHD